MSNFAYDSVFDGGRETVVGYETVNGTGEVYLDADSLPRNLSNEEARTLAYALLAAADEAIRRQWQIEQRYA